MFNPRHPISFDSIAFPATVIPPQEDSVPESIFSTESFDSQTKWPEKTRIKDSARKTSGLPDVAMDNKPVHPSTLDRVGMNNVDLSIQFPQDGDLSDELIGFPAKADIAVSIDDPHAKGIHMSRLYLEVQKHFNKYPLTPELLTTVLESMIESHRKMSRRAWLSIRFPFMIEKPSLLSGFSGWRRYPITVSGEYKHDRIRYWVTIELDYSSTCPCSAALSRQLQKQHFESRFGAKGNVSIQDVSKWLEQTESMTASPHSQRSVANIQLELIPQHESFYIGSLINDMEAALATPVQAAVKRVDEQEFARLNAENLMFCEDAARKILAQIEHVKHCVDYRIQVVHQESLHPHDAVATVVKGVEGGLRA